MLKGKRILVTAGGTQEFIDDIRVLTNISSGKLGAIISETLVQKGAEVYHVCGRNSVKPHGNEWVPLYVTEVRTAQNAMDAMKKIIVEKQIDAVIHAMAVSDFTFKRDKAIKLKSNDPEAFIEFMRQNIVKNPKIISHIKEWRPGIILVGFKFEVGMSTQDLIFLARESIEKNGCDMVVANDKEQMAREKEHVAHMVVASDLRVKHEFKASWGAVGKEDIASQIAYFLEEVLP